MTAPETFPDACRRWRRLRKLSQLDLALAAEVSQRHVSWLETGRSRPSREMVLRLSEALEVPLRDRNLLLQAAGFAAHYRESSLNDPLMGAVREALVQVLDNHEPFPAVVVDRRWNVKLLNRAAELMLDLASDLQAMQVNETVNGEWNLAQLTLHPLGLRPYITNWDQAAPSFIRRLRSESLACGDDALKKEIAQIISHAGEVAEFDEFDSPLLPVLPLELSIGGVELSLFSVISTFGTPQDVTTDELRIEAFYPADSATSAFFSSTLKGG